jgi:hypothetical protein
MSPLSIKLSLAQERSCSVNHSTVSNLQLRSNLLSKNYQQEMQRITYREVRDIWDRTALRDEDKLTPEQKNEHLAELLRDPEVVSMQADDRWRAWLELDLEWASEAVDRLEKRQDLELAFEILCITEQLRFLDSTYAQQAAALGDRTRKVLARAEFGLDQSQINQRLVIILGFKLPSSSKVEPPKDIAVCV